MHVKCFLFHAEDGKNIFTSLLHLRGGKLATSLRWLTDSGIRASYDFSLLWSTFAVRPKTRTPWRCRLVWRLATTPWSGTQPWREARPSSFPERFPDSIQGQDGNSTSKYVGPPTPLIPQMKVEWRSISFDCGFPIWGTSAIYGTHMRPSRPHRDFIFNLSMRESKARPVVVCIHHPGGRRHFRLGVSSSVGHCCQYFWVYWGPNQVKGRLRRGKCQRGQAGAANISWSAWAGRCWCCCVQGFQNSTSLLPSCGKSLFWMCTERRTCHPDKHGRSACKCGVGSLVHLRKLKFDQSHSDAAVLCAGVSFSWARPTQQPNERWVSRRIWKSAPAFRFVAWTYLRLGSTCPSKPPERTNQLHINPRDSISGFLQSRFANNEQIKKWTNAVPQQGFGQQRAALPNKLRRYAHMRTCNPWPVLEQMAQMRTSQLTIFICWALSNAQVPSEMIILTLPRRESFWLSLCQGENLLEAKPVDVRLRRNEGREGKSFSDMVRRKQRLVTAKQFSLPRLRSDSVFRRPWKGAQTSCHQQTRPEAKRKMLPRTWRRLFGLMRDSGPALQWWRAAPQPASWLEGARAPHIMNIPFERAHQGSDMVTFKRNWPSFAVLV